MKIKYFFRGGLVIKSDSADGVIFVYERFVKVKYRAVFK